MNGCRSICGVVLRAYETTGESLIWPSGQPYGKRARVKQSERYRVLMAEARGVSVAQAPGFSRDQSIYAYRKMFSDGNAQPSSPTKDQLRQGLQAGYAYSLSGDVRDVPDPTKLDDWVNETAHEIAVVPRQNRAGKWLVYEPSHRKSIWVPFSDVWAFTKRFRSGGRAVAIRVKAGSATQAAIVARQKSKRIQGLRDDLDKMADRRDIIRDQRDEARAEVARLIAECGDEDGKAAGWESAHVQAIEWHEQQRTEGPP